MTADGCRPRAHWIDPGLLVVAVVVAFWPSLAADFVWDDRTNLLDNPAFGQPGFVSWGWTHVHAGHYQPLTWMSFALDRALWGLAPVGYHLTNLVLHAVNAVLVLAIFRRLLDAAAAPRDQAGPNAQLAGASARRWGALFAAAVFALHPMRVESVTWVTERRDVLSTAFLAAATLTWLRSIDAGATRRRWLVVSVAAYGLSLLSKASGMGLFAVLLVLDVYPLRRQRGRGGRPGLGPGRLLRELAPYAALGVAAAVVALVAQTSSGAFVALEDHSLLERLAQTVYGIAYYPLAMFGKLSWSPLYERPLRIDPSELRFVVAAIAVVLVSVVAWLLRRRLPGLAAAWICYLVLVLPVAGVAQSGVQLVADRYSYTSCLGFALLLGGALARLWRRGGVVRVAGAVAALSLTLGWGALTTRQTRVWIDERRLWEHALQFGPSATAHNNLGALALQRGDDAVAWQQLITALEVMPSYDRPLVGLAALVAPVDSGLDDATLSRARAALERTLEVRGRDPDARFVAGSLALAEARRGVADVAAALAAADAHLAACLQARPDHALAAFKRGLVLYELRRLDEATRHLEQAVAADPDLGEGWLTLGVVSVEQAAWERARVAFERAVELLPQSSLAWTGRGSTRLQRGDVHGARADLERALQLEPGNIRARALLSSLPDGG